MTQEFSSPKLDREASRIAAKLDYGIFEARQLCGAILEQVNDHILAHSIWAYSNGKVDLAVSFMRLAAEVDDAGELTRELREKFYLLLDAMKE